MLFFLFAKIRKGGRVFTGGTERKLEIIKYICRTRKTTMQELANEFDVSVKTIQRDIDDLSGEIGIPIYTQSGKHGGIYVDKDYTMDRMYMTENEIELLSKIKNMVVDRLSEKESMLLDHVIKAYKKPQKKLFK